LVGLFEAAFAKRAAVITTRRRRTSGFGSVGGNGRAS